MKHLASISKHNFAWVFSPFDQIDPSEMDCHDFEFEKARLLSLALEFGFDQESANKSLNRLISLYGTFFSWFFFNCRFFEPLFDLAYLWSPFFLGVLFCYFATYTINTHFVFINLIKFLHRWWWPRFYICGALRGWFYCDSRWDYAR